MMRVSISPVQKSKLHRNIEKQIIFLNVSNDWFRNCIFKNSFQKFEFLCIPLRWPLLTFLCVGIYFGTAFFFWAFVSYLGCHVYHVRQNVNLGATATSSEHIMAIASFYHEQFIAQLISQVFSWDWMASWMQFPSPARRVQLKNTGAAQNARYQCPTNPSSE